MNREIKFRGKRVNGGEWVYGMTISNGTIKRKINNIFFEVAENKWVGVLPETLGQYTGLKDKNGVKIFEGDILTGQNCRFVVKYDDQQAEFVAVNSTLPKGFGLPMSQTWIDETNKIICGNIHDNPELIK